MNRERERFGLVGDFPRSVAHVPVSRFTSEWPTG